MLEAFARECCVDDLEAETDEIVEQEREEALALVRAAQACLAFEPISQQLFVEQNEFSEQLPFLSNSVLARHEADLAAINLNAEREALFQEQARRVAELSVTEQPSDESFCFDARASVVEVATLQALVINSSRLEVDGAFIRFFFTDRLVCQTPPPVMFRTQFTIDIPPPPPPPPSSFPFLLLLARWRFRLRGLSLVRR